MKDFAAVIEIDRIILNGIEVTPNRAKHIRNLVEAELQQMAENNNFSPNVDNSTVDHLIAPPINESGMRSDKKFANSLSTSIFQSLKTLQGK